MKKNILIFLVVFLTPYLISSAETERHSPQPQTVDYTYFENHPRISKKTKKKIKPYLLPSNHPMRLPLDAIFSKSPCALKNQNTLVAQQITLITPVQGEVKEASTQIPAITSSSAASASGVAATLKDPQTSSSTEDSGTAIGSVIFEAP